MAKIRPRTSKKPAESRIPVFSSIEEEAEFWDSHSVEEFADELEEVDDFQISAFLHGKSLTLYLTENQLAGLEKLAAAQATNVGDLVFRLIEERLAAERQSA